MIAQPRLLSLATAVPPHEIGQEEVVAIAPALFGGRDPEELARLLPVFRNAGITQRFSCVPLSWYREPHGWRERTALYQHHAVALLKEAAELALAEAQCAAEEIDALVAVSTTGITTPSLDALLLEALPFQRDVRRLPIFGLGCAGGVAGLARAADLARAYPGSRVLLLVVELCGLTFRAQDQSKANVIATALFGDGAAAAVLGPGEGPSLGVAGDWTWPNSLEVMGWQVEEDGLGVLFSRDIPALIARDWRPALERFLATAGLEVKDFDAFALHPGGAKVLDALAASVGLDEAALAPARETLQNYGNMSAPTALFVLRRLLDRGFRRCLAAALGPGFTASFQVLEQAS